MPTFAYTYIGADTAATTRAPMVCDRARAQVHPVVVAFCIPCGYGIVYRRRRIVTTCVRKHTATHAVVQLHTLMFPCAACAVSRSPRAASANYHNCGCNIASVQQVQYVPHIPIDVAAPAPPSP